MTCVKLQIKRRKINGKKYGRKHGKIKDTKIQISELKWKQLKIGI